jgi:hypothetical protein
MRYVITESKLDEAITDYLDEMFDVDNIHHTSPLEYDDETGEEWEDENRIEFYVGDYGDLDTCFEWYDCYYFIEGSYGRKICPMVRVENPYLQSLNGYFGNLWHEPFKRWFSFHFDKPVKTIE